MTGAALGVEYLLVDFFEDQLKELDFFDELALGVLPLGEDFDVELELDLEVLALFPPPFLRTSLGSEMKGTNMEWESGKTRGNNLRQWIQGQKLRHRNEAVGSCAKHGCLIARMRTCRKLASFVGFK